MQRALELAEQAEAAGEVPVGAIVVKDQQIIGEGYNSPISQHDPSAHAEIQAIRQAAQNIGNYRLLNTSLYVTLEPCLMCAGAMIHARIGQLIYATAEPRTGAVDSVFEVLQSPAHNHQISVRHGVLAEESAALLQAFFRKRRG